MEPIPESVGTVVGERRRMPRYHLLTRVDILVAGSGDAYWGSMRNLSRSGVAVTVRQHLRPHQRVTGCFHHQSLDGREADRNSLVRSEEHTSELQSPCNIVCRLLLEKKKNRPTTGR